MHDTLTTAGWQPIETAPEDGTWVLVKFDTDSPGPTMLVVQWSPSWGAWCDHQLCGIMRDGTHWMPLPEPPG